MKLEPKKYPILRALETGRMEADWLANWNEDNIRLYDVLRAKALVAQVWPSISPAIKQNVKFIASTYLDAVSRSSAAFLSAWRKDLNILDGLDDPGWAGCFIWRTPSAKDACVTFAVSKDMMFLLLLGDADTINYLYYAKGDDSFEFKSTLHANESDTKEQVLHDIGMYWMMEKYAKVETKLIRPGGSIRPDLTKLERVENRTHLQIAVRDCTWFTSICRNEGFMVRGHFRLQPKKVNGEWTKELIYINEFEKHGYHRSAQILAQTVGNNPTIDDPAPDNSQDGQKSKDAPAAKKRGKL